MRIKIKGNEQEFTLITIVSETQTTGLMSANLIKAVAYVYDSKTYEVKKFLADDIIKVAR